MASLGEPRLSTLYQPEVKPDLPAASLSTIQKGETFNPLVLQMVEPDQRLRPVGNIEKGQKKVKSRGWLALGVFFLTTAIGYGLIFMMIDNWLKG